MAYILENWQKLLVNFQKIIAYKTGHFEIVFSTQINFILFIYN